MATASRAARRALDAAIPGPRLAPSVLVVGGKRCGSTSLHEYLVQHPDVLDPMVTKGTRYFDVNHHRGRSWYLGHFPRRSVAERHRQQTGRTPITIESSPYYSFHPLAAERIHRELPGARLVYVLRDPVARTWSHYQYERSRGFEDLDFHAAIDAEPDRLRDEEDRIRRNPAYLSRAHRHFSYLARSHYADHLRNIYRWHDPDRVLVITSEELFAFPAGTMDEVFAFCDLAPHHLTDATPHKANRYDRLPEGVRDDLATRFAEPNEDLFELIGRRLPWIAPGGAPPTDPRYGVRS